MDKLTTEELLFAHRIGATLKLNDELLCDDGYLGKPGYVYRDGRWSEWNSDKSALFDTISEPKNREEIDFTPLYDWIEHDGGECPVLPDDVVVAVGASGNTVQIAASELDWRNIKCFMLYRAEDWPEQRADGGQSGNDGEHYAEAPEAEHTTAHHKRPDGTDLIDDWWETYPPEMARILMWEQVRKYMDRLGKKDPVHIEVSKMADYMRRWDKKERELAGVDDKPNTIV